jgi:transposase-like protein
MDKAKEWQNRPLESIYPIIFMNATVLKIEIVLKKEIGERSVHSFVYFSAKLWKNILSD